MASATRLAWGLAAALAGTHAIGSIEDAPEAVASIEAGAYSPLPAGYALSYDRSQWSEAYSVFHLTVAEPAGVIDSGFAASVDPRLKPLTRLDSSWTVKSPFGSLPVRLGDGVSSVAVWNEPVRLGGLQIGTLQPTPPDILNPPSLIADPYQNPGPVMLSAPRFVDHLRSIMQFDQPSLSTAGQADFSLESGRVRDNFELRSDDYGSWITSGTYRYGISDGTTVDGQIAQVAGQQSYVGLGLLKGVGPRGLVSARLASSRDQDVSGWRAQFGADFAQDRFSVAIRSHIQSPTYQDVGDPAVSESLRQRTLASAGMDLGALGRVSVASATQTYLDDTRRDLVAVSHAMPFAGGGVVSTAAAYSPGQSGSSALWLSFTYPFDYVLAPARRLDSAVDSGLERTIVDVFGQTRLPPVAGQVPCAVSCLRN
jgi:outer membrane usher protein FimD/PapC